MLALHTLVALQFDLLDRGTTDSAAIGQAVNKVQLVHWYTGEVATWNKEGRTLFLAETASSERDLIAIRLYLQKPEFQGRYTY